MSDFLKIIFAAALFVVLWAPRQGRADDGTHSEAQTPATPSEASDESNEAQSADALNERERQFAEKMSPSVLVGRFSVSGSDKKPPRAERYEISNVQKLRDDYWVFNAKIKYGKTDVTVPITLRVLWAGDTPVITLTDLTIPGLGTFTSRVMIYGDRYAGTWQHGKTGGHLWGHLEKPERQDSEAE